MKQNDPKQTSINDMGQLADALCEKLIQLKNAEEDYYICCRFLDNIGFLSMYKDALFSYVDGILLCERVFPASIVEFETNGDDETKIPFIHYGKTKKLLLERLQDIPDDVLKSLSSVYAAHIIASYTNFLWQKDSYQIELALSSRVDTSKDIISIIKKEQ